MNADAATAIEAVVAAYFDAYERHDATACADLYSNTALVLSPWGAPARGSNAIAALHDGWFKGGEENKIHALSDLDICGNLASCIIRFSADIPSGKGAEKIHGATLATLKCTAEGRWMLHHMSLNALEESLP